MLRFLVHTLVGDRSVAGVSGYFVRLANGGPSMARVHGYLVEMWGTLGDREHLYIKRKNPVFAYQGWGGLGRVI